MLDVHPPHEAAHTWKDFLIHIATIVVGLIIAVGLEQTVEAVHRHHERTELLENLRKEAETNLKAAEIDFPTMERWREWSAASLALLQHATLGAPLVLPPRADGPTDVGSKVAWESALSSGEVNLLDLRTRTRFSVVYDFYDTGLALPNADIEHWIHNVYYLDALLAPERRADGSFDLTSADDDQRHRITNYLIEQQAAVSAALGNIRFVDAFSTAILKAAGDDDKTYMQVMVDRYKTLSQKYPVSSATTTPEPKH
jgi:hypothetical protein